MPMKFTKLMILLTASKIASRFLKLSSAEFIYHKAFNQNENGLQHLERASYPFLMTEAHFLGSSD